MRQVECKEGVLPVFSYSRLFEYGGHLNMTQGMTRALRAHHPHLFDSLKESRTGPLLHVMVYGVCF
jgi:hypothetical protein